MTAVAKVAISMPAKTLGEVDALCRKLGRTRSSVLTEAARALLEQQHIDERDRRYMEAYLKYPERAPDSAAVASAAVAEWEPWK
jgi:metal-responsive CopG/Arc/MetJ family transcriptional regulator